MESKDLFAAMAGVQESSTLEQIKLIVDTVAKTRAQISACNVELEKCWEEKEAIKTGTGKSDDKKKRTRAIKLKMAEAEALKRALEGALAVQRKELENLNPTAKAEKEDEKSDGFSSGYDSS